MKQAHNWRQWHTRRGRGGIAPLAVTCGALQIVLEIRAKNNHDNIAQGYARF